MLLFFFLFFFVFFEREKNLICSVFSGILTILDCGGLNRNSCRTDFDVLQHSLAALQHSLDVFPHSLFSIISVWRSSVVGKQLKTLARLNSLPIWPTSICSWETVGFPQLS